MCRLVAYLGGEILLEEVLVKPANSLVMQSLQARESDSPTNGDGFGLGWYAQDIDENPALFTSISPAWNDRNLLHLTAKIRSNCFFAHVRAASVGGVSEDNCHPFSYGKWMLMHNGSIADFICVKRHLRHLLDDDIYNWIKGETDSEHFFALFLQLAKGYDLDNNAVVVERLQKTIQTINQLVAQYATHTTSYFNLCLTDGQRIFATRYCSNPKRKTETLHYYEGLGFNPGNNHSYNPPLQEMPCIMVSSEQLTRRNTQWSVVLPNHMLIAEKHHIITFPLF